MSRPRLSIVIPTYNGLYWLKQSLPLVLAYAPPQTEIIVVDDASSDGTTEWLRRFERVRVVRRRRNGGFCAAVNDGIVAARGEVVETLNNDAFVTPGWAEKPLKLFDDPSVAAVAPLVLNLYKPDQIDSAGDGWHLCGRAYGHGNRCRLQPRSRQSGEVFGVSASAGFFRRKVLLSVGLFPVEFGAYYDDIDLAFRIRYAGYRALYCAESRVYHAVHASYGSQRDPARVRQLARNEELVFWRNTPRAALPLALPMHLAYVLLHAALMWLDGRPGMAYLLGRLDAWGARRELARIRSALPRRLTVHRLAARHRVETSARELAAIVLRAARRRLQGAQGTEWSGPTATQRHAA